jgi:hypothetical protein
MPHFDPETLTELRNVFDEVCAKLPASRQTLEHKAVLAEQILKLAADGERDPVRLRDAALLSIA